MFLRTALAFSFLLLLAPNAALAGPCETGGLQGKYLNKCHQRLSRCERYRGSRKGRCLNTAVKNSLGQQERETERLAKKSAVAGKWKACKEPSYEKACYALRKLRTDVCDTAHKQPRFSVATNEPLHRSVARLTARYRAYAEGKNNLAAFVKNYGDCHQAPPRQRPICTFDQSYRTACTSAQGKFKAAWASYVSSFARTDLPRMLKEIEKLKRSKSAPTFMNNYWVDAPLQIIEEMQRVNKAYPWIAVPSATLDAIEKRVRKNHKKMRRTIEKMIAGVRCPVNGRSGAYFQIASKHLRDTKGPRSTMKEQIKRLGITGAAVTKVNPFLRITHQDLPGKMCVEQLRDGVKACRVFRMHFRRSKPFGGGWSGWRFYSIAGGQLMSCKNLR